MSQSASKLICQSCKFPLSIRLEDLKQGHVECAMCHSLYDLGVPDISSVEDADNLDSRNNRSIRPLVSMPKKMQMLEGGDWGFSWRWLSGVSFFLIFFASIWCGFLLVWNTIAFSEGLYEMAAFSVLHVAVGLFLIYKIVADFLNRTSVSVKTGNLMIRHGPVPWPGNRDVPVFEVQQVFCRRRVSTSKNGTSVTYSLEYLDSHGKSHILINGLQTPEQALFLEQEIEKRLGIRDIVIEGAFVG